MVDLPSGINEGGGAGRGGALLGGRTRFAAAVERGSAEARTAELRAIASRDDEVARNTREEVKLSREMVAQQKKMLDVLREGSAGGSLKVVTIP